MSKDGSNVDCISPMLQQKGVTFLAINSSSTWLCVCSYQSALTLFIMTVINVRHVGSVP